ncbi:MAG: hypothetical protein RL139_905 [Gemmatimonadota bacterium]|jgi:hypothetical protein
MVRGPKPPESGSLLDRRVAFAEKYVTDSKGRRFSLEGREWVRDELWRALDGFKLWPVDRDRLCSRCVTRVGEIVLDPEEANAVEHAGDCAGLEAAPIIVTVACLERRAGKTFNSAAYVLSTLFLLYWRSIAYVAAAFGQTAALVLDNFTRPIDQSKALGKLARIVGNTIAVEKTKSRFEFVPTSHRSITGRGRTIVIIDEARDVAARTAMALLPSVLESHGYECPNGHVRLDEGAEPLDRRCTACGTKLRRWQGRILIMSSAGLSDGAGEHDWFRELVTQLEQEPQKNYHLIRMDSGANPLKSSEASDALSAVFGRMESTQAHISVELGNQFARPGDDAVTEAQIKAILDKRLVNAEGSTRRSVGFLDTSDVTELTSIVIMAEEDAAPDAPAAPWARLFSERIDYWRPADQEGHTIDERLILAHLDVYMPLFPMLTKLAVDVRGRPWAERLVKYVTVHRPWGRRVIRFTGRDLERVAGWSLFRQRVQARPPTIRLQDHPVLRKELGGLRVKPRPDGSVDVVDKNRRRSHADIADGIASCCYLVHLEQVTARASLANLDGAKARGRGGAAALMDKVFRPVMRGMREDGF